MKNAKAIFAGARLLLLLGLFLLAKEVGALAGTKPQQSGDRQNMIVKSCGTMLKVSGQKVNDARGQ